VAPAFSNSSFEQLLVRPFPKAKPEKLLLTWMLNGVCRGVLEKAWAAVLKYRGHCVRQDPNIFHDETEPIRKRSPFDEFGNGDGQAVWSYILPFGFCLIARLGTQRDFSLRPVMCFSHQAPLG
jgi:hypothetical protein